MENARWKHTYACYDPFTQMSCSAQYQTETSGDTLIGSLTYSKLIRSGGHNCSTGGGLCSISPFGPQYVGAMRQDTVAKTVYIRLPLDTTERVLYDFSQPVGAIFNSIIQYQGTLIISSYDSILIGTVYHRRMNFAPGPFFSGYCIIEGIGSTSGLIEDFVTDHYGSMLDCVYINGQSIYPNPGSACSQVYTGIETTEVQHCTVMPNPFRENFKLELSKVVPDCELELYDVFCRKIFQRHYQNVQIIEAPKLQWLTGIYLYRIMNNKTILASGKVIAE